MNDLLNDVVRFDGVKGVGTIKVDFEPNQRVYTFIGANGVGKTKLLECLFTVLLLSLKEVYDEKKYHDISTQYLPFKKMYNRKNNDSEMFSLLDLKISISDYTKKLGDLYNAYLFEKLVHSLPCVYLAAQNRGNIQSSNDSIQKIGSYQQRSEKYLEKLFSVFRQPENFKSLNMDTNLEEWIIQRAQSANPYQSKADNRKIELDTLLSILNQIDERIDSEFLEISGDNRVFIKVEGQKRELAELSSGFTSILKMVQSIIAGYSYLTNEQQIARVRGVVLIDEIESHLHNEWQVKIIPLLKKLFPNTTFLISTHSSLVISQLAHGEAYRLQRHDDGVVYGELIEYPNNMAFVDLLNEAFDVNLNQLKIERLQESEQTEVKQALLSLVQKKLAKLETK